MAREEIGENLPFLQIDHGVAEVAARLSTSVGQDYRLVIGALYVFWHGLAKRKRLYRALLLELRGEKARVLLEPDELKVRLYMAFGFEIAPSLLVAVDLVELESSGFFKVCGMDRYLDSERGRLKKKGIWPPPPGHRDATEPEPTVNPNATGKEPGSHPGRTRNGVKPTVSVRSHPGRMGVRSGFDLHGTAVKPQCDRGEGEGEGEGYLKPPPNPPPPLRLVSPSSPKALREEEAEDPDLEPAEPPLTAEQLPEVWTEARSTRGLSPERVDPKTYAELARQGLTRFQWEGTFRNYVDPAQSKGADWVNKKWPLRFLLSPRVLEARIPTTEPRKRLCVVCRAVADHSGPTGRAVCGGHLFEWRDRFSADLPAADWELAPEHFTRWLEERDQGAQHRA